MRILLCYEGYIMLFLWHFVNFLHASNSVEGSEGWKFVNLYCRDDNNKPVDWWHIYKPPMDDVPFMEFGRNFSYIVPGSAGRWLPSDTYITSSTSMLMNTLSPMFRKSDADFLAYLVYEPREVTQYTFGSSSRGILMANEMGGLWITHTVPNLPDLTKDHVTFPTEENTRGHLLSCLSLDLVTLNEVAATLKQTTPKVTGIQIPELIAQVLPDWVALTRKMELAPLHPAPTEPDIYDNFEFITKFKSVKAAILVRKPGGNHCLYEKFAKSKKIVLDVYGPTEKGPSSVCREDYSVRTIDSISLKFPETVYYINNHTDEARFAVSTAAHWQRQGSGPVQYWTCVSNLSKRDLSKKGGHLLCVEDYDIWITFDNMKVKEPVC